MKNFDISNLVLTSLEDVRRVNLASGTSANRTAANCTIIIKRSGSSLYSFGKKSFVADANNIIFIAKGTEYSLTVEKHGEATVIEFDIAAEQLQNEFQNGAICQYSTLGDKSISKLAKNLCQYYALRGPAYYSKCFSELYSLTTQISTVHAYNRTLAGKYGLIHESVKFIQENYARQDLYTPMLAEFSGIGETYYRNIFQAVFGMAPAHYIQIYRVGKAKELLLTGSYTIEEIAIAVGFANASYFCKVFKNITHITPSEFAQMCKALG